MRQTYSGEIYQFILNSHNTYIISKNALHKSQFEGLGSNPWLVHALVQTVVLMLADSNPKGLSTIQQGSHQYKFRVLLEAIMGFSKMNLSLVN